MLRRLVIAAAPDPALGNDMSEQIALAVRYAATQAGVCACGATVRIVSFEDDLSVISAVMEHEPDCPAVSVAADRAVKRVAGGER